MSPSGAVAGDEGASSLADFIAKIQEEIRTKTIRKMEVSEEGAEGKKK